MLNLNELCSGCSPHTKGGNSNTVQRPLTNASDNKHLLDCPPLPYCVHKAI